MADRKISQLTPTTTVDLADKYAMARGANNFYLTYETLQNNLTTPTGSFVKTVNGVSGDSSGNVAVSLASVETGLSSSFPPLPTDGDVYVISGETATDRTGSNGESFIYSSASADWFRLSGLDEAGNDARYVNVSGDTMTGDLILSSDPTVALEAATKQYVDGKTAVGTNGQTLRFNGTTLESTSTIFNNGTSVGIGTTTPKAPLHVNSELKIGSSTLNRDYIQLLATGDTGSIVNVNEVFKLHASGSTSTLELRSDARDIELNAGNNINAKSNRITNVVDPTTTQDAATKGYVDGLLTSTITGAVWDPTNTQQTYASATKITFNANSSRQTTTNDSSQVSWSTTNNEMALGEGTWHIMVDIRKDTQTSTGVRFFQIQYKTTAGTGTSGTLIDAAPSIVNVNGAANEKIHMEAFLTVPASTTYYVFTWVASGGDYTARFPKMLCKRIA